MLGYFERMALLANGEQLSTKASFRLNQFAPSPRNEFCQRLGHENTIP